MKKIKKNIIEALEYLSNNPNETITKVSNIFKIDRHTLSEYKNSRDFNCNNLFAHQKEEDEYLYYFTDDELMLINYYKNNSDKPYQKIKEKFPNAPDKRALRRWMDILGLDYETGAHIKYHYDRTKFKEINTEEDAYWLGFITADGCIVDNKIVQIKLQKSDYKHLEKFCHYMGLNDNEIKEIIKDGYGGAYNKDNEICVVKICSVEIVNNLKEKGVLPNKSGKEEPYKCSSVELEKAYIRGLVDGDGYLRNTEFGFGIVGSEKICNYIKDFLNTNVIDTTAIGIYEHGVIKKFQVGSKIKSSTIIHYLYNNANIYLDRKFKIYQDKYII